MPIMNLDLFKEIDCTSTFWATLLRSYISQPTSPQYTQIIPSPAVRGRREIRFEGKRGIDLVRPLLAD